MALGQWYFHPFYFPSWFSGFALPHPSLLFPSPPPNPWPFIFYHHVGLPFLTPAFQLFHYPPPQIYFITPVPQVSGMVLRASLPHSSSSAPPPPQLSHHLFFITPGPQVSTTCCLVSSTMLRASLTTAVADSVAKWLFVRRLPSRQPRGNTPAVTHTLKC